MHAEQLEIWETYKRIHLNYLLSVNQAKVLSLTAGEVLSDFPNRLPENIREPLLENIREFTHSIGEQLKKKGKVDVTISTKVRIKKGKFSKTDKDDTIKGSLFISSLITAIAKSKLAESRIIGPHISLESDFEEILYSQELVMYFAHLDAFIDDSLRIVCKVCPEILKCSKKINWESVISCGNWEKLIYHFTEKLVREESSAKSLNERLNFLRDRIGLSIVYPKSSLSFLENAELYRHLVVHNSGRVNDEFIERTGRTDLEIGMHIPITFMFMDRVSYDTLLLAGTLFEEVAKKFFALTDSSPELELSWHPPSKK